VINEPHPSTAPRAHSSTPLRFAQNERGSAQDAWHLVIAGGKGWMADPIFEQVKRSGLEGRVHFSGFVDDADLPALYSAAELFAYVSLYEGFGLPLLEAMACGTPIIGSKTSSLPEVMGEAGLPVDPMDVDAIAHALREMIDRLELRERSIGLGLERARLFTWEKAARELLAIYEQLRPRRFPTNRQA
jgi:glycosyltransferase involved in cell wall biosynthesis